MSTAALGQTPFTVRNWLPESGLPTSTVKAITQTPDGYLWLATSGGLARFDGLRFEVFGLGHGLTSNRIYTLAVGPDSSLFATCEDGSLARWDGDSLHVWTNDFGWPSTSLCAMSDGSLIGRRSNRVWRFANGAFRILPDPCFHGAQLVLDGHGRVWSEDPDGAPCRLDRDRLVRLGPGAGVSSRDHWIRDERTGRVLWVEHDGSNLELRDDQLRPVRRLPGAADEAMLLVDRQNRLWSASGTELVLRDLRSGREVSRIEAGLAKAPNCGFVDRDDNVWLGTDTQGLLRISPSPLRVFRPSVDRPTPCTSVVETIDGQILATTDVAGVWRVTGSELRFEAGRPRDWVGSTRTRWRQVDGHLEIADAAGSGIVPGEGPWVASIVEDPARPRTVYVSFTLELGRLSTAPGSAARETVFAKGPIIRDVLFDRSGVLWLSTVSGLWRLAPGDTQKFARADGLPADHLRQLHEDRDGTLWIGTYGAGLVRMRDGRFATLDRRHGLLEEVVSTVLEDDDDNLWLMGNNGIQRISRTEANECLDGKRKRLVAVGYGRESGLRNPETSGSPGLRSRDGRLWFLTIDGLAMVDPRIANSRASSPPVAAIEGLSAGDDAVPRGSGGYVLAPNQRRFSVRYTGIDLGAPEQVRFRHRLIGFDRGWIEAGNARVATYTNVPPGRYVLRVAAIGGTGAEGPAPAETVIELRPHLWETRVFQAIALVLAVLAVIFGWRLRSRGLRKRADQLQQAVVERTAELEDAQSRTQSALTMVEAQAQRLEALDRARSRFFASISHEFRTPLTLIQGPLQDVRDGLHGEVRGDAREQVSIALGSATRLQRLVDQLLDAARAEAGELRIERRAGDLIVFLDELALAFAPLAERRRVTFTRQLPRESAFALFDPQALEKVFANLLGNAFKFTPEGGHVTLAATRLQQENVLDVAVADDGPGIAAEDLPRVFERFYRAERSVTRVQTGTGLGLALAHDMVEQHEGTIRVESREGEGSTFTVRLPLLAAEDSVGTSATEPVLDRVSLAALADEIRPLTEENDPVAVPVRDDGPTVLVVDDHPDVRAYVARQLGRRYRVIEAADGAQALDLMRASTPDVVVSDVTMPVMDGLALCSAIREDPELEFVPVILLTAAAGQESRIEGLERGADAYLAKPFEVRELLAIAGQLLDSRRRLRERLARQAAAALVFGDPPAAATDGDGNGAAASIPRLDAAARSSADQAFVRRLREVIAAHMGDEDFDVERLAEAMGMGRTLLYQRTSELLQRTPMDLVFHHRLERAAELLAANAGGVGEIAYAVGFRNLSHFTIRFRERFGLTPSAWKRGERPAAVDSATT